jgi:hypothetical protein
MCFAALFGGSRNAFVIMWKKPEDWVEEEEEKGGILEIYVRIASLVHYDVFTCYNSWRT